MTRCVFDQVSTRCIEHGGRYTGSPECAGKAKGDRLEKKIARLTAKRKEMTRL